MDVLRVLWVPFITAFIGWFTNWLAIKMLFRPRKPIGFGFIKIQGLIPRRHKTFAENIATIVEREIISSHTIKEEFQLLNLDPYLQEIAKRLVRQGVGAKLKDIPFIGGFINDETLSKFEAIVITEIQKEAGPLMDKIASDLESRVHIKSLIEKKISEFELERLESVVEEVAKNEFQLIEWLGGILGFVIGIGQLVVLWLTGNFNF